MYEFLKGVHAFFVSETGFTVAALAMTALPFVITAFTTVVGWAKARREKRKITALREELSTLDSYDFSVCRLKSLADMPQWVKNAFYKAEAFSAPPSAFISSDIEFRGAKALKCGVKAIFATTSAIAVFLTFLAFSHYYNHPFADGAIFSTASVLFTEGLAFAAVCFSFAACADKSIRSAFDKFRDLTDEKFKLRLFAHYEEDSKVVLKPSENRETAKTCRDGETRSDSFSSEREELNALNGEKLLESKISLPDSDDDYLDGFRLPVCEPAFENAETSSDNKKDYGNASDEMKEISALLREESVKPEDAEASPKMKLDEAFKRLLRAAHDASDN